MRRTALVQITVALMLSLAAGVLIFRWMEARTAQAPALDGPQGQVMVAVAAQALPRGERLTPENLRLTPFLAQSVPQGAFHDAAALAGRMTATDIGPGEPVTEARLLGAETAAGGVSTLIAPGMRAVAVKGNMVMGLSGFVRPGNRVDVLVTVDIQHEGRDVPFTKTVLENIKVLATGADLEVSGGDGELAPVDIYTLELSPAESEKLAFAATKGTLNFALRNPDEGTGLTTPGVQASDILDSLRAPARASAAAPRPRPAAEVELITGSSRQVLRFANAQVN